MARKNQRLINFHTSGLTSMPVASDVHYGEIVVRHNKQQPELLIKVSESEFGVIPGSGAVASAISVAAKSLQNKIEAVDERVNTVSGDLNTFKTTVADTYATKTGVTGDIKAAKDSVYSSATTAAAADATAKANKAKEDAIAAANTSAVEITGKIDAVDDRVDTVSASLNTFKTTVADTYATKTGVTSDIATAKSEAISTAAGDATTKANKAKEDAIKAAAGSADTLNKRIDTVDGRVDTVSASLNTFKTTVADTYATKTGVTSDITSAKNSVYSSATTAAAADATTKANTAKSDAIKAAAASADTLNKRIDTVDGRVDTVSASLNTFKTTVANTYETKDNVSTAITAAKNSVYSSATTAAATDATTKANKAKEDAIGAAAASAKTLQNNIDAVNNSLTGLSASTVSIKTTADKAVQTASIVDGATCKVSVSKVNTELKFDFRNIVIDCGDF